MSTAFTFDRKDLPDASHWALEASAGTGKTWTIQQLVTHCLADREIEPGEIVVVTFTRAAAAELRSRIRSAVAAELTLPSEESKYCDKERARLQIALSNISKVRVTTIHRFAQQSLASLGVPVGELSSESSTDHFLESSLNDVLRTLDASRLSAIQVSEKSVSRRALKALKVLANNPGAKIIASAPSTEAELVREVVERAQVAIEHKKRILGLAGYDDLLTSLHRQVRDPQLCEKIASSMKVLLVDEFQDTDGLQWEIFKRLSAATKLKMFVTVGDPKQAIYGFRGGDVQVYREAVPEGARTLEMNRRSSQKLLDANNAFFEGQTFGSQGQVVTEDYAVQSTVIAYQKVEAAGDFKDSPMLPPWEFRKVNEKAAGPIRQEAMKDVATYIRNIVGREQIPVQETGKGPVTGTRAVDYRDLCILITSNAFGRRLTKYLLSEGIPAAMIGGANVFTSDAAQQWTYLLEALSDPTSPSSARLLAFSWFGGSSAQEIVENLNDEKWLTKQYQKLTDWNQEFLSRRSTFFDVVIEKSEVRQRLITFEMAERNLTDLQHVAEILAGRSNDDLHLLLEFMTEANPDSESESEENADFGGTEWSRRIDRDSSAVKIMTVHRSKGLQFPIVLTPYLAERNASPDQAKAYRVLGNDGPLTVVDLTTTSKSTGAKVKAALEMAENKRLGYVAFTRAIFRNVSWTWQGRNNPLFDPKNEESLRERLARDHHELFAFTEVPAEISNSTNDGISGGNLPSPEPSATSLALFSRKLATSPERHSFTTLSKQLRLDNRQASSESEELDPQIGDVDAEPASSDGDLDSGGTDFADVRSSKYIGVAVHSVLQYVDVEGLNHHQRLEAISQQLRDAATTSGLHLSEHEAGELVKLVDRSLKSNLGAIADNQLLQDFSPKNLLPELGFDFLICGADDGEQERLGRVSELVDLLNTYLGEDPICRAWLSSLNVRDLDLTGMLTGSIDAVLGWKSGEDLRFLVVDYKTNKLTNKHKVENYDSVRLIEAMGEHHYQLQALIYLVALHRYLRSRLNDYDYNTHVAGSGYLFLRGMRENSTGSGVVAFTPPKALIESMSDFFDGNTNV